MFSKDRINKIYENIKKDIDGIKSNFKPITQDDIYWMCMIIVISLVVGFVAERTGEIKQCNKLGRVHTPKGCINCVDAGMFSVNGSCMKHRSKNYYENYNKYNIIENLTLEG